MGWNLLLLFSKLNSKSPYIVFKNQRVIFNESDRQLEESHFNP
jgi:hypothetical protein